MTSDELYRLYLNNPSVSIDTRTLKKGDLFFALKGPNFDGNQYAEKALKKGASYAIIDNPDYKEISNTLLVNDTLETLQALSTHHRKQLTIPVIGIGGSNGKTTTKELIHAVLSSTHKTIATKGNFNNHIGVPLSLLSIPLDASFAIIELGANHSGENANLCNIALPNYGLITNNGKDHLEGFGSVEGVIKANNEIYEYLHSSQGMAFVHAQDQTLMCNSALLNRHTYGAKDAHTIVKLIDANPFVNIQWKGHVIPTKLTGSYNLPNLQCAIAIGEYFKVSELDIVRAISAYTPSNNRSQFKTIGKVSFILDAYNANPTSMMLSIESMLKLKAPHKGLILGDMFELGKYEKQEHQHLLNFITEHNFSHVHLIGEAFFTFEENYPFSFFKNTDQYLEYLKSNNSLLDNSTNLIKGSRGMKLERVLEVFENPKG